MKQLTFLVAAIILILIHSSCDQDVQSGCRPVTESIYMNDRFPSQTEQFHPDSLRAFNFEYDFKDSVAISVRGSSVAKKYIATTTSGLAGVFLVKAQANDEIIISTTNGCAHFRLKDGYKFLYINRVENKDWRVTYSNVGRGYL